MNWLSPTYKEQYKRNIKLAAPVMVGSLGHIMVGVADSLMVGQFLGAIPLAAVSLANSVFHIPFVFAIGVAFGLTPLVANADGEGDIKKAAGLWKNAFYINLVFGILLSFLLVGISPVLDMMNQEPEVVRFAGPYFNIISWSMIPFLLFLNLKQFAEGLSDTLTATRISLAANVLNVVLNYVLIKGVWGFPEMGLNGAAWASFIARISMFVGLWLYIRFKDKFKQYWEVRSQTHFSWEAVKRILNIGVPSGLQYIFEVGAFAISAILVGVIGALPQAAHQVSISLASISYMAASGLSAAAAIRVGNQLGKKDYRTLHLAAVTLFRMVAIFMTLTGIVFITGRFFWPSLFTDNATVIGIAAQLLIITTIFQISDGVQVVAQGALRGLSDTRMPTFLTFISYWVISLPLAYVLGFFTDLGVIGIWIGLAVGLTINAILLYRRFMKKANGLLIEASILPVKEAIIDS
jgi:MATE family multidrug resistance protein